MLYPSEIPLSFLLNAVLSPHFPLFFWCAMKGLRHSAHLKDYNHDPYSLDNNSLKIIIILQRTLLLISRSLPGHTSYTAQPGQPRMVTSLQVVTETASQLLRTKKSVFSMEEQCFKTSFEWLLSNLGSLNSCYFIADTCFLFLNSPHPYAHQLPASCCFNRWIFAT